MKNSALYFIIKCAPRFPDLGALLTGPVDFYLPLLDLLLTPLPLAPALDIFLLALDGSLLALDGSTRYDIKGSSF